MGTIFEEKCNGRLRRLRWQKLTSGGDDSNNGKWTFQPNMESMDDSSLNSLAALFHGIFPGATAELLGLVNQLLPGPGGIGEQKQSKRQCLVYFTINPNNAERQSRVAK
jgi:hypothetical protein